MSPSCEWIASGRRLSRGLSMTSKDLLRMRWKQKWIRLWLRWQTTLTCVWMRVTLRNCGSWGIDYWIVVGTRIGTYNWTTGRRKNKQTIGVEKEPPTKFTVKHLAEAFADLKKLFKRCKSIDPPKAKYFINREECSWCIIICSQANHCGGGEGKEENKQIIMDILLKGMIDNASRTALGRPVPSGGVPEEGIVIGDDSVMSYCPWKSWGGHNVEMEDWYWWSCPV